MSDADSDDLKAEKTRLEEIVKRACAELGEHFGSVRIFVTYEPGQGRTASFTWHSGNWYASYGQIGEWMGVADARSSSEAIRLDEKAEQEREDDET